MSGSVNTETILRSPNFASTQYDLSGTGAPRQRNTFLVRFIRGDSAASSSSGQVLSFGVKSVDRPSVQIQTEELHQYNKKRQVHTGWKASPVKVVFYDTVDGKAIRMFANYASHYFGDFRQGDSVMWKYDVTTEQFEDNGSGFGFTGANGGAGVEDINAQFYFDSIEIIYVSGAGYEKWVLVNPRIVSFDPDDLDYENSAVSLITASFAYEAILYQGGAITEDLISQLPNGTPLDLPGQRPPAPTEYGADATPVSGDDALFANTSGWFDNNTAYRSQGANTSGALGIFGQFNFGAIAGSIADGLVSGRGLSGGLSNLPYIATSNPIISTILNSAYGRSLNPLGDIGTAVLGRALRPQGGLPSALWDAAQAGIQGSTRGTRAAQGNAAGALARGVVSSIISGTGGSSRTASGGVTVPNSALGATNAIRPSYAQYGFRS